MNIPRYHQFERMQLGQFIVCYELRKASKSMKRLIYHLGRCKRQEDKSKLLVMTVSYIIFIVKLMLIMMEGWKEMTDLLIIPLPQKPQLLIENL